MSSLGLSTDSDLRPLGIGAFQGDSSLENQSASVPSSSNPDLVTSSSPSSAVDSLEFLEFMSKNSIEIIPYDQFTLERGIKDGSSGDSKTPALELKGANMQVIKARWNDEIVALKVFQAISTPGVGSTAYGMVERIQQYKNLMQDIRYEIQVMNQSRRNPHRNILNLLGVSFEEGSAVSENGAYIERYFRPILVTPHAHETYPDLRHYLRYQNRPRPLPYDECVRLIGDIADGIHGLHHVGVVHADLKPENILIFPFDGSPDRDIVAKVADFGFSGLKVSDTGVPRGGTRVWNAPECLRGCADEHLLRQSGEVTRDTYSFGLVMVHIMLDGGEPLPFGDHEALDEMKLNDEAREEALGRLRKYYLAQRGNAEPHELERLEQVINETILRDPSKRRKTLEKVRSELIGGFVLQ
jgi:serine/threonine protein kinase